MRVSSRCMFKITSFSLVATVTCSQLPELCDGCPEGLVLDGLICRPALLTCPEGGGDSDRDGIPDSCDTCPYVFNPEQTSDLCAPQEGVCPGVREEGILWSATSAELTDRKPCPPPLIGTYATCRRPSPRESGSLLIGPPHI